MNQKNNNRYTHILITVGAIIVIILGGFLIFQHHNASKLAAQEKFNKTHFNPNVTIYNVKVGGLTKAKAYTKVNQKAKNKATLENTKLSFSKTEKEVISKKEINQYFKKQHTRYTSNKNYNYENVALNTAEQKLNAIKNRQLTYHIDSKSYNFERSELLPKVSYYEGQYQFENVEPLKKKIESINKKVTTFHKSYPFKLPDGKTITVKNESYGWAINTKHLIPAVEKAFIDGKKEIQGKNYIYGLGFSTYGTGYGMSNNGIGDTYIVVSLKQQKVWFYKKGKKVLVLNDVVTGTAAKNPRTQTSDATPTGVWYIEYKQSPSVLRGLNDDGSSYASPVKYWMPFTISGCGFHDASWRTDWSKTAYLKGGSHGCVNVKPSEIKKVWDVVEEMEPVIIYNK
ncbi:L,D-transpeptidase family protein [uncultured Lactobacillus sp.]|uniref:L,D-transpeptidase family protein n=1 Tax=uncultured Lactobacillus sp. TaxID=153152 RepID=UPI00262EDD34|nr:L,D-transpeptidase family protein [uncultured Lactobacillus sp.]